MDTHTALAPLPAVSTAAAAPIGHIEKFGRNWFRWEEGQGRVLLWLVAVHALAITGLVLFPLPGWGVITAALAIAWCGGIGTTVAYHRAIAHKALRLNPFAEFVLVGFAVINGSGVPATWAANHRLHHAKADTPEDLSSPLYGGFWWSHLRWLWQTPQSPVDRWAPDLERGRYAFWSRWQWAFLILSLGIGLPFGFAAFFWLGAIRLLYSMHGQLLVNSAAHLSKTRNPVAGTARDLPWLAVFHFFQGESWHAAHHSKPSAARIGRAWWQVDVGWWVILLLERLGLARDVRRRTRPKSAVSPSSASPSAGVLAASAEVVASAGCATAPEAFLAE